MQTIETTDPIEARRARFAQYRGGKARFTLMGSTITGIVRPVMEVRSSTPVYTGNRLHPTQNLVSVRSVCEMASKRLMIALVNI